MKRLLLLVVAVAASAQGLFPLPGGHSPIGAGPSCTLTYTTDLEARYKADDASNVCTSGCTDGNVVTTLNDSSGNNNDAVNASSDVTLQTNEINGLPVFRFPGTSVATNGFTMGTGVLRPAVFYVVRGNVAGMGQPGSGALYGSVTANAAGLLIDFDTKFQYAITTNNAGEKEGTAVADTNWHQGNSIWTASNAVALRIDQADDGSASGLNTPSANTDMVGGAWSPTGWPFIGDLEEILFYSSPPSGGDRDAVEDYLNCRTGL